MKNFIQLFNRVDGNKIMRQYCQAHVLFFSLLITVILGFSKKSLEIVRLSVNNRILSNLRKKYGRFITTYLKKHSEQLPRERSNKVWICWLQGIENAPDLVQRCYQSIEKHMLGREIILLTEDNYRSYVTFPDFIQEKIESGIITRTHMSDLLRLELLLKHGGTWIDATVYCSGKNIPEYMLDSDLFLFQELKPGLDGHCTRISSWFMTSCTNHPILLLTKDMLYDYWKVNRKMIDYFLLHDFFELAIEAYPKEWDVVIPFSNCAPHILLLRLFEAYDEQTWKAIKIQTPIHKMTYKFDEKQSKLKGTYFDMIFS